MGTAGRVAGRVLGKRYYQRYPRREMGVGARVGRVINLSTSRRRVDPMSTSPKEAVGMLSGT